MSVEKWKALFEEDPSNELVKFSLAKAYLDQKQWDQARELFQQLVIENEDYALAWAFLARCCMELGDLEAARLTVQKGLPVARKGCHEIPLEELEDIQRELEGEF